MSVLIICRTHKMSTLSFCAHNGVCANETAPLDVSIVMRLQMIRLTTSMPLLCNGHLEAHIRLLLLVTFRGKVNRVITWYITTLYTRLYTHRHHPLLTVWLDSEAHQLIYKTVNCLQIVTRIRIHSPTFLLPSFQLVFFFLLILRTSFNKQNKKMFQLSRLIRVQVSVACKQTCQTCERWHRRLNNIALSKEATCFDTARQHEPVCRTCFF